MLNNLSILRKKAGYSQEVFAGLLNVTRQTIISLERGRYNPSILLAFKISRLLNKTIEEIFIPEEGDLKWLS